VRPELASYLVDGKSSREKKLLRDQGQGPGSNDTAKALSLNHGARTRRGAASERRADEGVRILSDNHVRFGFLIVQTGSLP